MVSSGYIRIFFVGVVFSIQKFITPTAVPQKEALSSVLAPSILTSTLPSPTYVFDSTPRSWVAARVCLRGKTERGRLPNLSSHPPGKEVKVEIVRTLRGVTMKKKSLICLRSE